MVSKGEYGCLVVGLFVEDCFLCMKDPTKMPRGEKEDKAMFAKCMEVRSVTERLPEVIHSLKGVLLGIFV